MPKVTKSYNPLTLSDDIVVLDVGPGTSPNDIVAAHNIGSDCPVILLVNGKPLGRADWDIPLQATDIAHFIELPRGGGGKSNPLQAVAMLALIAVAAFAGPFIAGPAMMGLTGELALAAGSVISAGIMMGGGMLINQFFGNQAPAIAGAVSPGAMESVYSITSSRNTLKLGSPFPEHFGRFICYPDLAMSAYTYYSNLNDQYFRMIGIIGVGEYEITMAYIDKSPMVPYVSGSTNGAQYNIITPGDTPRISGEIVWVSSEISGQELAIKSKTTLSAITSAQGTDVREIEVDIIFPNGLAGYTDRGHWGQIVYSIIGEARGVDDLGEPTTAWNKFYEEEFADPDGKQIRVSRRRRVPQNIRDLGMKRVEVRLYAVRLPLQSYYDKLTEGGEEAVTAWDNNLPTSWPSGASLLSRLTVVWAGLKAIGPPHPNYGGVTMIECLVKASNEINGDIASKINVLATRKLKSVTANGFAEYATPSRSPIDACAYIVTSENGGRQPDSRLDFPSLAALRATLEARGNYFDWRFTSRTSVMEACAKAARVGRAIPYMPGGKFALVRDEEKPAVSQVYTEDDYTKGSLEIAHAIRTEDSPTCVEVQYIDKNSWQTMGVRCYDAEGNTDNPAVVQIDGITSRQHAYEEGWYMYLDDKLNRTVVSFAAGLKGHIPKLGDNILVAAPMTNWGQSGLISKIDGDDIYLSDPVDFGAAVSGKLYLTLDNGTNGGPYTVSITDNPNKVAGRLTQSVKTVIHDGEKASKFIFATTEADFLRVRVTKIMPSGTNEVRIVGSIINNAAYAEAGTVQ